MVAVFMVGVMVIATLLVVVAVLMVVMAALLLVMAMTAVLVVTVTAGALFAGFLVLATGVLAVVVGAHLHPVVRHVVLNTIPPRGIPGNDSEPVPAAARGLLSLR